MRPIYLVFVTLCLVWSSGLAAEKAGTKPEQESSGGTVHCDICEECHQECTWVSCNCQPNPGGTIHCDLCPTNCKTVCTKYSCNCRPGAGGK